jgi:hypothetical protein
MFGRIGVFLIGLLLLVCCVYAIYSLVNLILSGALAGSWIMVLAGGILLYLFLGFLVIGCIFGFFFMISAAGVAA